MTCRCCRSCGRLESNISGQAIDTFAAYWQKYGDETGFLTVSIHACRALAKACEDSADKVSGVKTEIEHKAEELVAMTVAAAAALVFSFGISAIVEVTVAEQVVVWATSLIDGIATTVGYTSATMAEDIGVLAAPIGAVAGAIVTGLPAAQESAVEVLRDGGTGAVLGVLAEATPVAADGLTSAEPAGQVYQFSPQVSAMLTGSSKFAAWLDTAVGKAFLETGRIEGLKKAVWLDEKRLTSPDGTLSEELDEDVDEGELVYIELRQQLDDLDLIGSCRGAAVRPQRLRHQYDQPTSIRD